MLRLHPDKAQQSLPEPLVAGGVDFANVHASYEVRLSACLLPV